MPCCLNCGSENLRDKESARTSFMACQDCHSFQRSDTGCPSPAEIDERKALIRQGHVERGLLPQGYA